MKSTTCRIPSPRPHDSPLARKRGLRWCEVHREQEKRHEARPRPWCKRPGH